MNYRIAETVIRPAQADDLDQIISIYNVSVRKKNINGNTEPWKLVDKVEWFWEHLGDENPIYVVVHRDKVVGWLCINSYRPEREAMRFTKEISYYISHDHLSHGFGALLIKYVLEKAESLNIKTLIASMLDSNKNHINLLKKFGFKEWGYLPGIAKFNGNSRGHYYFGLHLEKNDLHEEQFNMNII